MGVFSFAVVLTLLLIVALALVGVSILASAFAPRRRERPSDPTADDGGHEQL